MMKMTHSLTGTNSNKRYALGKVISLGSSSDGNAYYIEINRKGYPNPYNLLLECGLPYKELTRRLLKNGLSIRNVNGVLVSHEHHDHSISVPELINRGKTVFAPQSVFNHYGVSTDNHYAKPLSHGHTKRISDCIDVLPFKLEHKNEDGSNIENLGYIIQINADGGKHNILFATDTHYIRYNLSDWKFHTIFIEANNFTRNIMFSLKEARASGDTFKSRHYDRVLHSHMTVENTVKTLCGTKDKNGFDLSETDIIYLIHLTASGKVNPHAIKEKIYESLKTYRKLRAVSHNGKKTYLPKIYLFKKHGEPI